MVKELIFKFTKITTKTVKDGTNNWIIQKKHIFKGNVWLFVAYAQTYKSAYRMVKTQYPELVFEKELNIND